MIQNWYQSSGLVAPTGGISGYCQARSRLKESFLRKLSAKTNASLQRGIKSSDLWHGHVVKSIDSSSVLLMDTEANQLIIPPQYRGRTSSTRYLYSAIHAKHKKNSLYASAS